MDDLKVQQPILPTDPLEGHKETEIGFLPEEWKVVPLGGVVNLVRGISWRKAEESPDGTPVVAIPNTHGGRVDFNIRYRIRKNISSQKRLHEGNILLVGSSGSVHNVGRTAVVKEMPFTLATFASFLVKAEPSEEINHDFLYFLLGSKAVDFSVCSKRAADGKYNLQVQALRDHMVPLPPLPEQQAISHVLSTVQKVKEATEKVIVATRELKRSLMHHLFTYGHVAVDEAEHVPLKETEVGVVPEHWKIQKLGDIARTTSGGTPKRDNPSYYGGSIPWVKSGELNDSVVTSTTEAITEEGLSNSSAKMFPSDTLLVAMYGATAGKVGILGIQGATNQAVCAIFPGSRALSKYIFHTLIFRRPDLLGERYGGAQPNLNQTSLRSFVVPLPPLHEQDQITRTLSTVDLKMKVEENRRQTLEVLFKTLLHNLMTGKVRVEDLNLSEIEEMV